MALSDQQIITGISILVAGFLQFDRLSVYHWQTVVYLAWMSSVVHLASLTYLRNSLHQNRVLRAWRLAGMLILFCLLFAALWPTTSAAWADLCSGHLWGSWDAKAEVLIPARYFWDDHSQCLGPALRRLLGDATFSRGPSADGVLSYMFLVMSYAWKVLMLFDTARTLLGSWTRAISTRPLEFCIQKLYSHKRSILRRLLANSLAILYFPILAICEIARSFAGSLWTISFGLIWGTFHLLQARAAFAHMLSFEHQENSWGFGQVLPMLLLMTPLVAMGSRYFANESEQDKESFIRDGNEQNSIDQGSTSLRDDPSGVQSSRDGNENLSSAPRLISTLFLALDECDKSTLEHLYATVYTSTTFNILLVMANLGVLMALSMGIVFDSMTQDIACLYIAVGAAFAVILILLFSACSIFWSRLYR